jgi:hypothetical protein
MVRGEPNHGHWRKSRRCDGGSCVEIGQPVSGLVAVRDSDDPAGLPLVFTSAKWRTFTDRAKRSAFDAGTIGGAR